MTAAASAAASAVTGIDDDTRYLNNTAYHELERERDCGLVCEWNARFRLTWRPSADDT